MTGTRAFFALMWGGGYLNRKRTLDGLKKKGQREAKINKGKSIMPNTNFEGFSLCFVAALHKNSQLSKNTQ